MPERIMYVQLKTGSDIDAGPSWISRVRFSKTGWTTYFQDRLLHRVTGTVFANNDANFYDVETGDHVWVSGPKRDQTDARYRHHAPTAEDDVREAHEAILRGASLPGRKNG